METIKTIKTTVMRDGIPHIEKWEVNEILSRLDGPAYIEYDVDGNVILEMWYFEGNLNRLGGPAKTRYEYFDGLCVKDEEYYIFGVSTEKDSHNILIKIIVDKDRNAAIMNIKHRDIGVRVASKMFLNGQFV